MNPLLKRYGIPAFVFLVGLTGGAVLSLPSSRALLSPTIEQEIAPNTEILSILDEEVMFLSYSTDALTLTAQRSKPADRFAVQVTFADGRKPQQCLLSPDLAGLLASFSSISAKRQIQIQSFEKAFPQKLGRLEIRDRLIAESPPALVFRTSADRTAVAVAYDGHAAEVSTPINAFANLEAGCGALFQH